MAELPLFLAPTISLERQDKNTNKQATAHTEPNKAFACVCAGPHSLKRLPAFLPSRYECQITNSRPLRLSAPILGLLPLLLVLTISPTLAAPDTPRPPCCTSQVQAGSGTDCFGWNYLLLLLNDNFSFVFEFHRCRQKKNKKVACFSPWPLSKKKKGEKEKYPPPAFCRPKIENCPSHLRQTTTTARLFPLGLAPVPLSSSSFPLLTSQSSRVFLLVSLALGWLLPICGASAGTPPDPLPLELSNRSSPNSGTVSCCPYPIISMTHCACPLPPSSPTHIP